MSEPAAPRTVEVALGVLVRADAYDLDEGPRWEDMDLSGLSWAGRDLTAMAFSGCDLTAVDLDGVQARRLDVTDCVVDRWSPSVLDAPDSRWARTAIAHSRIGAATAHGSVWDQVTVTGCKVGFFNLRSARLTDVRFVDCVFDDLDLMDAALERVAFEGCTARSLTVRGARHTDTDLRGLDFHGIDETAGLGGATISEQQLSDLAPVMAAAAGIRVEPA
ncbi:pentapeptide repeat-containing protein [Demequina sp. NBRC 110051]|uniref:pentapeptide repeat-containing protein n=1 Tax=Demequina sp. NBRC 110051 TaxID=1570340 RepID=UPI001180F278|nr:pentapeptide repeat-containing protein [Demequina sp. NBRC 110051]